MAACEGCNGVGQLADGAICRRCKGAGTNGVDLSIDAGRLQHLKRETSPKLCMKRVGNDAWCQREDAHAGDCYSSVKSSYGPLEAMPRIWRDHKGRS